jgi:hypothetical protein
MQSHKRAIWLFFGVLVITALTAMATLRGQDQDRSSGNEKQKISKEEFESQFPIADYSAPEVADPEKRAQRKAKGKKYNNPTIPVDERRDTITSFAHWATGLPALPVAKSQAIVIGWITDAHAYLSDDKTNVYSEFTLRIDEVLKDSGNASLISGNSVIIEREGGRVRFPSGHMTRLFINGQGLPRIGKRYIFFLTHNFPMHRSQEEDFYLLTGHELRDGKVFSLDNPGGGTHPVATTYQGTDEASFLNDVRTAIATSR